MPEDDPRNRDGGGLLMSDADADPTKHNWTPFLENITESATACLITMVQGNVLALTLSHWLIASRTGIIAGVISSVAILVVRIRRRWIVSSVLGGVTACVDYFAHPTHFGPAGLEAVVTGLGAALLSHLVGAAVRDFRRRTLAGGRHE